MFEQTSIPAFNSANTLQAKLETLDLGSNAEISSQSRIEEEGPEITSDSDIDWLYVPNSESLGVRYSLVNAAESITDRILAELWPLDMYYLSLTCKFWHRKLWSRYSLGAWKRAFAELTFVYNAKVHAVPDPPPTIAYPHWAAYLLRSRCMACWAPVHTSARHWAHLTNLCHFCCPELYLPRDLATRRLAAYRVPVNPQIFEICISVAVNGTLHFYLPEVERIAWEVANAQFGSQIPLEVFKEAEVVRQERISLAHKVIEWTHTRQVWLQLDYKGREAQHRHLVNVMIERCFQKLSAQVGEEVLAVLKHYHKSGYINFEMSKWLPIAVAEGNEYVPSAKLMSRFAIFLHPFTGFVSNKRLQRNAWKETSDIRNLMAPHYRNLRNSPESSSLIWPSFANFLHSKSGKQLLHNLAETHERDASHVQQAFGSFTTSILQYAQLFHKAQTQGLNRDDIKVWLSCKNCQADLLTLYDLESHICFSYQPLDLLRYKPERKANGLIGYTAPINIMESGDHLMGTTLRTALLKIRNDGYIEFAVTMARRIIPALPATHSQARKLKFICCECAKNPAKLHATSSYIYIIRQYIDSFKPVSFLVSLLDPNEELDIKDPKHDALFQQLMAQHLVWKEVSV